MKTKNLTIINSENMSNEDIAELEIQAEKDNAQAQFAIGLIYGEGFGVAIDHQKSNHYLNKAIDNNFEPASLYMANKYYKGEGIKQNYDLGDRYLLIYINLKILRENIEKRKELFKKYKDELTNSNLNKKAVH
ncbi:MAG: sel1 repeat family protein [Legionellales bacterium]|nr:sel1 repeat family protein [Legionellales bacterium]